MRLLRSMVCSGQQAQVFHVISRVVDRNCIFNEEEKGRFMGFMRQLEAFTGVEVLSYCLMGNHFHLLLHVPAKPEKISDEEVRGRMKALYGEKKMGEIDIKIEEHRGSGDMQFEVDLYDQMRRRMYDLSSYVRDLKWRFSKWYNVENERKGTLWEERFRSVLVEPSESAMMRVAAYIELNPVRAGLVDQPHEYRWSSFTEAVAGGELARQGIMKVVAGLEGKMSWDKASRQYRSYFLYKAAEQNQSRKGLDSEEYAEAMKNGGELDKSEELKTRLRYFTEGLVIGSESFLKRFVSERREQIGEHRKKEGYKVEKGKDGMYAYRQVK